MCLLWRNVFKCFFYFLIESSFCDWVVKVLYIYWIQVTNKICALQVFFSESRECVWQFFVRQMPCLKQGPWHTLFSASHKVTVINKCINVALLNCVSLTSSFLLLPVVPWFNCHFPVLILLDLFAAFSAKDNNTLLYSLCSAVPLFLLLSSLLPPFLCPSFYKQVLVLGTC